MRYSAVAAPIAWQHEVGLCTVAAQWWQGRWAWHPWMETGLVADNSSITCCLTLAGVATSSLLSSNLFIGNWAPAQF